MAKKTAKQEKGIFNEIFIHVGRLLTYRKINHCKKARVKDPLVVILSKCKRWEKRIMEEQRGEIARKKQ